MALEWVAVAYAAGAEAMMLLLLTLPGLKPLRNGLLSVTKTLLKPFFSILPICLFLVMDIYWKYEMIPSCKTLNSCSPSENMRHQKSTIKEPTQRTFDCCSVGFLLALVFCNEAYWSSWAVAVSDQKVCQKWLTLCPSTILGDYLKFVHRNSIAFDFLGGCISL